MDKKERARQEIRELLGNKDFFKCQELESKYKELMYIKYPDRTEMFFFPLNWWQIKDFTTKVEVLEEAISDNKLIIDAKKYAPYIKGVLVFDEV